MISPACFPEIRTQISSTHFEQVRAAPEVVEFLEIVDEFELEPGNRKERKRLTMN